MQAVFSVVRKSALCEIIVISFLGLVLAGCGTSTSTSKKTDPAPPQPNYPATPPVPITWSPSTTSLPAPPACNPPQSTCDPPYPDGSNNFPLSVASPLDQGSVTSPVHVVANATPKNPLFFMRVYVDQLAVYYTFTDSIDT